MNYTFFIQFGKRLLSIMHVAFVYVQIKIKLPLYLPKSNKTILITIIYTNLIIHHFIL